MIAVLVSLAVFGLAVPALAAAPPLPPESIANPAPIPPSLGIAWIEARLAALAAAGQAAATPVAVAALLAGGFALLTGWLFGAHPLRRAGQWLLVGALGGYLLIMAAPRLVMALQGWVLR